MKWPPIVATPRTVSPRHPPPAAAPEIAPGRLRLSRNVHPTARAACQRHGPLDPGPV